MQTTTIYSTKNATSPRFILTGGSTKLFSPCAEVGSFCAVLGSAAGPESIREEAKLPTYPLIINENLRKITKNKKIRKMRTTLRRKPKYRSFPLYNGAPLRAASYSSTINNQPYRPTQPFFK